MSEVHVKCGQSFKQWGKQMRLWCSGSTRPISSQSVCHVIRSSDDLIEFDKNDSENDVLENEVYDIEHFQEVSHQAARWCRSPILEYIQRYLDFTILYLVASIIEILCSSSADGGETGSHCSAPHGSDQPGETNKALKKSRFPSLLNYCVKAQQVVQQLEQTWALGYMNMGQSCFPCEQTWTSKLIFTCMSWSFSLMSLKVESMLPAAIGPTLPPHGPDELRTRALLYLWIQTETNAHDIHMVTSSFHTRILWLLSFLISFRL